MALISPTGQRRASPKRVQRSGFAYIRTVVPACVQYFAIVSVLSHRHGYHDHKRPVHKSVVGKQIMLHNLCFDQRPGWLRYRTDPNSQKLGLGRVGECVSELVCHLRNVSQLSL